MPNMSESGSSQISRRATEQNQNLSEISREIEVVTLGNYQWRQHLMCSYLMRFPKEVVWSAIFLFSTWRLF